MVKVCGIVNVLRILNKTNKYMTKFSESFPYIRKIRLIVFFFMAKSMNFLLMFSSKYPEFNK